ncbi:hypothetical protein D3C72_2573140 [compost metagenome]
MPILRPMSATSQMALNHSVSEMIFIGMTAGPLVAKRMRRTLGMLTRVSPIRRMFLADSW